MRLSGVMLMQGVAALALAISVPVSGQTQAPDAPQPQAAPPARGDSFQSIDYSKPRSPFPNIAAPYMPRHVAPLNLNNSTRVQELIHDGKLMLSMDDAIALALENNLDLVIARYNLSIADTDVLRTKAGASALGTPIGIVQNTPGGGVGGLGAQIGSGAGGTNPGTGGAGAGTNGLALSTQGIGPAITSFDPILSSSIQNDHAKFQCTSIFCGPVTNTTTWNFLYSQGFRTGTNLTLGFNNQRIFNDNPFNFINPTLNSNFSLRLTQPLLQGFGLAANTRFIQVARNNREETDVAFRQQVTTTVDQIENMYWDLVYAYENLRVQNEALAFARKTLSDTQKQVEIGSLAPIETVRAQNTVAQDQQNLTIAQTNLRLQQLLMKNALSRNLQDPVLAQAEVIPISTVQLPAQEPIVPVDDLINDALSHRAELAISRIDLVNRRISLKSVRNAMLPTVNAFAYYGGTGVGGSQNADSFCAIDPSNSFCQGFVIPPSVSYSGTLNQLVNSTAPDKGAGLTVNIPLRNREGQADQVRSELEYRQAEANLQQIENKVRIEVQNAQFGVQQNRASVDAAQAAVDLAKQTLDAEQKKYALGASTTTLVLQQESGLATAESTLLSAQAAYEKARVELDRSIGLLLEHSNIEVADAQKGQVSQLPHVPYVMPRQDVNSDAVAQPAPAAQPSQSQPDQAQPNPAQPEQSQPSQPAQP
jgi:outer membrane protein